MLIYAAILTTILARTADDAVIKVNAAKVIPRVSPMLHAACVENVNHEIHGVRSANPTEAAHSAAEAARLKEFYQLAEKYGADGVKQLENGRFRFYDSFKPADKVGEMAGRRFVREWDPLTGAERMARDPRP